MNNSANQPSSSDSAGSEHLTELEQLLDELDATMYRMGRLMSSRQSEFSRDSGLPAPHFMVLKTLACSGPTRISDLAILLGVKNPAVSMLVQSLEADGLINRAHDTEDNRVVRVSLTAEGEQRLDRAEGYRRELMKRLTGSLDLEDLRAFVRIMDALAEGAAEGAPIS